MPKNVQTTAQLHSSHMLAKQCSKFSKPCFNSTWTENFWRTDAEVEAPMLLPPDAKNWLHRKDPDAGKDWKQEEKGMTEDEIVGWHHKLDGHEFEQALRVGDGQGSLAFCSPWDHKEQQTTEWLNWTDVDHNKMWKILKEMEIPNHLSWLLRNLYARQEAIVRTRHGTMNWF